MKLFRILSLLILVTLLSNAVFGATIKGRVTDAQTGDGLWGANIVIVGTSLGAASDLEGEFIIQNVPDGTLVVSIQYIGYVEQTVVVEFNENYQLHTLDIELKAEVLQGEEVVVSTQALGQMAAINKQLSADAMVNIVDAERIQELPDQNVAESIGRLPGISVTRNTGEGNGVAIRGLAPQYNQVQIDGVVMSASTDLGRAGDFKYGHSRSVSLSNISSENLAGIEVYKAILPDMNAATLGGTVNMRLGRAPKKTTYEGRLFGGYNAYQKDWGQYKVLGKVSFRALDDKFGMQFSINAEQLNRGSDRLSGDIRREDIFNDSLGTRRTQYRTAGASIKNIRNIRKKQNVTAIFDYVTDNSELLFSNFYNHGEADTKEIRRSGGNLRGYDTESESQIISNSIRGSHNLSPIEIDWQLSHFWTKTDTPHDYAIWFAMKGEDASELNAADKIEITPEDYIQLLPDDGTWGFNDTYKDEGAIDERKFSAKLDIKYPFFIGDVSGFVKTGFLLSSVERNSELKQRSLFNGRFPNGAQGPVWSDFTSDYNPDPVLNGEVSIRHYFDVDKIEPVWTDWIKDYEYAAYNPLKTDNLNYNYKEKFYAGYFMFKFNAFKNLLTVIPGVRYEGNEFDATGYYHYISNASTITTNGIYEPRNAKRNHGFWLPMIHIKVKPTDWFDARLAITKTISRPSYRALIPFVTASFTNDFTTSRGEPDLKTTESWNFDLTTSFYHSKLGLVTLSGFYKELTNFSYSLDYFVQNDEDAIKYGLSPDDPAFIAGHYTSKDLKTYVNTPGVSTVKGFEIDYQANFINLLPGYLKNITFGINYTRTFSESWLRQYEVSLDSVSYIQTPPYVVEHKTFNIGFRRGPLPTQPKHLLNLSIGYDIGGFSGRFSTFFQGRSLAGVGKIETADTYIEDFVRYDMSIRYKFNENLSFMFTGQNLSSTADISSLNGTDKHSSYSVYGTMYEFGVIFVY